MKDTINEKELVGYLFGYVQRMRESYKALYLEITGIEAFTKALALRFCKDAETEEPAELPSIEQLAGGHAPASISSANIRSQIQAQEPTPTPKRVH